MTQLLSIVKVDRIDLDFIRVSKYMDRFFKTFKRPKQTLKGKDTGLKVHGIGNGGL